MDFRQPIAGPRSRRPSASSSVEQLERTAERMSMGSDIGAEIRKIQQQQKRRDSNHSSILEVPEEFDGPPLRILTKQRTSSSASRSIVETNNTARRGGLSSASFASSPHPSFRSSSSGTRTRPSAQANQRSIQSSETPQSPPVPFHDIYEDYSYTEMDYQKPPTPPTSDVPAPLAMRRHRPTPPITSAPQQPLSPVSELRRASSKSSSTRRYHQQAQAAALHPANRNRPYLEQHEMNASLLSASTSNKTMDRSVSTASKSTMQYARSLFGDFDGVHYSPISNGQREGYIPDEVSEDGSADDGHGHLQHDKGSLNKDGYSRVSSRELSPDLQPRAAVGSAQNLPSLDMNGLDIDFDREEDDRIHEKVDIMPASESDLRWFQPPPSENMVYYPAPVPMSLNLPQRLSKAPTNGMRRSQLLGSMPLAARQSALWNAGNKSMDDLRDADSARVEEAKAQPAPQRQSALDLSRLPPQLRASVFFEHQSVPHNIKIKDGSAVATLDSLLDASARAPAVHTPADLDLSGESMPKVHKRGKSSALSSFFESKPEATKSRISLLPLKKLSSGILGQRSGSGAEPTVEEEDLPDDMSNDGYKTPEESQERDDLGDADDDEANETSRLTSDNEDEEPERPEMPLPEEQYEGAPNTLMAELQLRKQQLRSRNRTAATAFPNGMHSTLLELDAVEQIEKKRRMERRTNLAWEDPVVEQVRQQRQNDENVPLAVLFPTKHGLGNKAGGADWNRPLGLLVKKQLEDSEPLSRRRNRLRGGAPDRQMEPQMQAVPAEGEAHSEHGEETLADRNHRVKTGKALDEALGGTKADGFASDMMSQFGGLERQPTPSGAKIATRGSPAPEEETLGQRRKRLQAQAQAQGDPNRQAPKGPIANDPSGRNTNVQSNRIPMNASNGMAPNIMTPQMIQQASYFPPQPMMMPNMMQYGFPQQPGMNVYPQQQMAYIQQAHPYTGTPGMQQSRPSMQQYAASQMSEMDAMMMTTKQRENIDRWRERIMP